MLLIAHPGWILICVFWLHLSFFDYCKLMEEKVMPRYDAAEHWAKIEVGHLDTQAAADRIARRYPVDKFNAARRELDPKNILANDIINSIMPREDTAGADMYTTMLPNRTVV